MCKALYFPVDLGKPLTHSLLAFMSQHWYPPSTEQAFVHQPQGELDFAMKEPPSWHEKPPQFDARRLVAYDNLMAGDGCRVSEEAN